MLLINMALFDISLLKKSHSLFAFVLKTRTSSRVGSVITKDITPFCLCV